MSNPRKIGIYGATGFTGQLVAQELEKLGADYFIAGRDATKLGAMSARLRSKPETLVAQVEDPASLAALCKKAGVLANCAGPFLLYGPPVVAAAVEAGSHYLDTTGETPYMRKMQQAHDATARKKGCCLIPGAAYEYALSDLLLPFSVKGFESVESIEIGYLVRGAKASMGTKLSILQMIRAAQVGWENGRWQDATPPSQRTFPGDGGRPVGAVTFGGGEILFSPLHVKGVQRVRTYITGVPSVAAQKFARTLLNIPPFFSIANALMKRTAPAPTELERQGTTFVIVHEVKGRIGGKEAKRPSAITGRDAYLLTGQLIAEQAVRMAAPEFKGAGFCAPAQVFDTESFRKKIESWGVTHKIMD